VRSRDSGGLKKLEHATLVSERIRALGSRHAGPLSQHDRLTNAVSEVDQQQVDLGRDADSRAPDADHAATGVRLHPRSSRGRDAVRHHGSLAARVTYRRVEGVLDAGWRMNCAGTPGTGDGPCYSLPWARDRVGVSAVSSARASAVCRTVQNSPWRLARDS
jgi:hypothetical protein